MPVTRLRRTSGSVEGLHEVEAIKQLKARYCRYLDTKDWDAWRAIFADDFLSDTCRIRR